MIASRLWYLVLGIAIGFLTFLLFVASSMFDRASKRTMSEGLAGDAQVVSWYIRDDARRRSSALINFALDPELSAALGKSSASDKVPADARDKTKKLLKAVDDKLPADLKFTSLFAIDQNGRVVAYMGYDQAAGIEDFEMGGYPVVADALHGWIRDDSWVLDGRIYRVVARPVEGDTSQPPAGAIVGARIVDDAYARELSKRTGAAVAFFAANTRVAAAAPEGFDTAQLDAITADLSGLSGDQAYKEKGRSDVRVLRDNLGVVYSLIPGEAWELGAGFAVGRSANLVGSPAGFLAKSDDTDKQAAKLPFVIGGALLAAVVGLLFTLLEHNKPLNTFKKEAGRFAKGEVDQLAPSKFLGTYRQIASDVNDGLDKLAAKGLGVRKAADLEQVLGPIPAQPSMSAFSFPGADPPAEGSSSYVIRPEFSGSHNIGKELSGSHSVGGPGKAGGPPPPRNRPPEASASRSLPSAPATPFGPKSAEKSVEARIDLDAPDSSSTGGASQEIDASADGDDTADWPQVFEEFVRVKKANNEPAENLTFEKFQKTLRKHREALVAQHGCKKVKFTVYVKDNRAALKASPVK
jgi:hypothetical protein